MMSPTAIASLFLVGLAVATPVIRVPTPEEIYAGNTRATELAARDGTNVNICKDNGCGDCPIYFGLGSGYPDCPLYYTDQLNDKGYTRNENGQLTVYFDFPQPGPGCKYIIRTPVVVGDGTCGAPTLIAEGAQCALITLSSTMLGQFCCGSGDCGAAGTPPGRRGLATTQAQAAVWNFVLNVNGSTVEPMVIDSHTNQRRELNAAELAVVKRHALPEPAPAPAPAGLSKRCGNGDFVVTKPRYYKAGQTSAISGTVTCPPDQSCSATEDKSVTQESSFSASITVGDPLGIISATAGFEFSQSLTRSFSAQFMFGAGETGYVAFTPVLSCVEGYFNENCDNAGQVFEACTATEANGEGSMNGDIRGVTIRQ